VRQIILSGQYARNSDELSSDVLVGYEELDRNYYWMVCGRCIFYIRYYLQAYLQRHEKDVYLPDHSCGRQLLSVLLLSTESRTHIDVTILPEISMVRMFVTRSYGDSKSSSN
jgi:hypothetical protein